MKINLKRGDRIYGILLFALCLFLCLGLPLLNALIEGGVILAYMIQYTLEIIRLLPPFIMLGAAFQAMKPDDLRPALPYFFYYAGVNLLLQFPSAALAAYNDVTYTVPVLLVGYIINSIFSSACFLLLLVLGYLLFIRAHVGGEAKRFWDLRTTYGRALGFGVLLHVIYSFISEVISIYRYLFVDPGKVYPSGGDVFDFIFRLLFCLVLAFPMYAAGHGMQLCLQKDKKN